MAAEDVRIAEQVRRVLARHWIDQTDLRFSCTRGVLRFFGTIRRIPTDESLRITDNLIELLALEIRRLSGVEKVYFAGVQLEETWVEAEEIDGELEL